jgi:opacity protein-like surface antigen
VLAGAPLLDRLWIFGRLGIYRGTVKESTNFAGDFTHDNTNFTFGLGLSYDIIPHLALRGEWQRYYQMGGGDVALGADVGEKSDVDVFGISALWRF